MVRRVSWWIWTALAKACWSRPLLWPDVWLPSALKRQHFRRFRWVNAAWFPKAFCDHLPEASKSGYEPLPVMFFVHQVIASTESYQMGIIGWCWDGNWAGAAHIRVAKLVGKDLEFIWWEVVVIPQHMVVRWPAGSLHRVKTLSQWCVRVPIGNQTKKTMTRTFLSVIQKNLRCSFSSHLNASVTAKVKVKLWRMSDFGVHCGACRDVAAFPNLQKLG